MVNGPAASTWARTRATFTLPASAISPAAAPAIYCGIRLPEIIVDQAAHRGVVHHDRCHHRVDVTGAVGLDRDTPEVKWQPSFSGARTSRVRCREGADDPLAR